MLRSSLGSRFISILDLFIVRDRSDISLAIILSKLLHLVTVTLSVFDYLRQESIETLQSLDGLLINEARISTHHSSEVKKSDIHLRGIFGVIKQTQRGRNEPHSSQGFETEDQVEQLEQNSFNSSQQHLFSIEKVETKVLQYFRFLIYLGQIVFAQENCMLVLLLIIHPASIKLNKILRNRLGYFMSLSINIPPSDLDVEDIRLSPPVREILQYYELVILIAKLITTCKMIEPFFGALLMVFISDSDAGLRLKGVKTEIFGNVLLEGSKRMRHMIGKDLLVELSLGTIVSLEELSMVCGQQLRLLSTYLSHIDLEAYIELALHGYA